jgi:hypothetical protein
VLLAALQNTSRENAAAGGSSGSSAAAQVSSGAGGGSSSSSAAVAGRIDYKGIYLQGIPPNTTKEELEAMFAAYGKVVNVMIIGVKWHATKCAFVNYADAAAAQKVGSWHCRWLVEMARRAFGIDQVKGVYVVQVMLSSKTCNASFAAVPVSTHGHLFLKEGTNADELFESTNYNRKWKLCCTSLLCIELSVWSLLLLSGVETVCVTAAYCLSFCRLSLQALAVKTVMVGDTAVVVKPKVTKGKADAAAASSSAGASLSAAGNPAGNKQQSRWLGQNELGLPMVRGAACCPFFMGTAACTFKSGCRYHHPMHAMHPECVLQGKAAVSCVSQQEFLCIPAGGLGSGLCPVLLRRLAQSTPADSADGELAYHSRRALCALATQCCWPSLTVSCSCWILLVSALTMVCSWVLMPLALTGLCCILQARSLTATTWACHLLMPAL